ncbi:MAG: NUDIX domain-containing protein [Bacteroidaceae bacterium]|nr:NUDIX domain-containing protein [Bacteroidaceae bacterium]
MHYLDKFKYCPACGSVHFDENDFKSKRCADCGFTYYFNASAATVAIIENEKGELLVCRRGCEPAKGTLDLIGGFVDPGETSEGAIAREILEETGIDINSMDLKGNAKLTYLFSGPNTYNFSNFLVHTTDAFFHILIPSSTKIEAHDDVAEVFWVKRDEVVFEDFGLDSVREGFRKWLGK